MFNVEVYNVVEFMGLSFRITETLRNTWIIGGFLILLAILTNLKMRSFKDVPSGFQSFMELIIEMFDNFVESVMGKENKGFGPWFFGVFCFVILSNMSGLVGLRPATADLLVTASFGFTTFLLIHFTGITRQKADYWKGYFEPMWLFFPINLIGELALPISLSFRLFGNILGGFIIMELYYSLMPIWLKLGVPAIFHIYFDIFAGALQAYIIVTLSMTFLRQRIPD